MLADNFANALVALPDDREEVTELYTPHVRGYIEFCEGHTLLTAMNDGSVLVARTEPAEVAAFESLQELLVSLLNREDDILGITLDGILRLKSRCAATEE